MSQRNDCATLAPLLPWYVAGTLAADEAAGIAEHLASCAACRADLALWRGTATTLARTDAAIPRDTNLESTLIALAGRIHATPQGASYTESRHPMRTLRHRSSPTTAETAPIPSAPSRRPVWPALLAAIVIVALMVGVFAELAHRSGTGPAGRHQTQTSANTQPTCAADRVGAQIPANADVTALTVPAGGDGWAIYDAIDDQSTPSQLLRLHNCIWTVYGSPYPADGQAHPPVRLTDIAFSGPDDGWAVGVNMVNGLLAVFRYTGGNWHALPVQRQSGDWGWTSTAGPGSLVGIREAHVLLDAVGDVWIAAGVYSSEDPVIVERYARGKWASTFVVRSPVPGASQALDDASVDPQGDLWLALVGANQQVGFMRYSQGIWTMFQGADIHENQQLIGPAAIRAFAPDDVWATMNSSVLHFTGTRWVDTTPPALANMPSASGVPVSFTNIGVVSPTNLWFFVMPNIHMPPAPPQGPLAWHHANGTWSAETPLSDIYGINGLRMMNATQGWAVGIRQKLLSSSSSVIYGSLLFYDSGTWTAVGG